mmetsp:Transcript_23701/g.42933  ORF Transcript_23701/g.42933 Transcript_23701/m.42933 type:complete len:145 (-) Transcript_23701:104-538(-)
MAALRLLFALLLVPWAEARLSHATLANEKEDPHSKVDVEVTRAKVHKNVQEEKPVEVTEGDVKVVIDRSKASKPTTTVPPYKVKVDVDYKVVVGPTSTAKPRPVPQAVTTTAKATTTKTEKEEKSLAFSTRLSLGAGLLFLFQL